MKAVTTTRLSSKGQVVIPGIRLPGDSSIDTGMEWAGIVEARATTRFLWWTLHLTREAAVAALFHAPGTGSCVGLRGHGGQGLLAAERSYRSSTDPRCRPPGASAGSISAFHPARRSAAGSAARQRGRSGAALTRAAAEARIRRGRGGRRRATSWRTARAGRGCVGGRCVRRWRGPAVCRRPCGCGCRRTPCG